MRTGELLTRRSVRVGIAAAGLFVCLTAVFAQSAPRGAASTRTELRAPSIPYRIAHGLNDFMSFYVAGKLCGSSDLYRPMRGLGEELKATGYFDIHTPVVRLPYFALAMAPLSRLPYRTAYTVFQALSILSIIAFVMMQPAGRERTRAVVLCVTSFPLLLSLGLGQDVPFVVLFVAVFLRYWDEKPEIAGAALALCSLKYHLFPFMALVVILRGNRRLVVSLTVSLTILLAISFAIEGPNWPREYIAQLMTPWDVPDHMPNIRPMVLSSAHPLVYGAMLSVVVGIVATIALVRCRENLMLCTAIALAAGILATYHVFLQDCAILLPPLVGVWNSRSHAVLIWLAWAVLMPLAYVLRAVEAGPTFLIQALLFAFLVAAAVAGKRTLEDEMAGRVPAPVAA